jgi:hypothetical protein
MKASCFAAAAAVIALALPAVADEVIRGYVTQIEVNSATNEVRIWLAHEKGVKGRGDLPLDPADPMLRYKLDLARDSLKLRLPMKVALNARGMVASLILRVYPSSKQRSN